MADHKDELESSIKAHRLVLQKFQASTEKYKKLKMTLDVESRNQPFSRAAELQAVQRRYQNLQALEALETQPGMSELIISLGCTPVDLGKIRAEKEKVADQLADLHKHIWVERKQWIEHRLSQHSKPEPHIENMIQTKLTSLINKWNTQYPSRCPVCDGPEFMDADGHVITHLKPGTKADDEFLPMLCIPFLDAKYEAELKNAD